MISGPPGRLPPIFGPIRHEFDVNFHCRGQIRHDFDTILTFLSLISGSSCLHMEGCTLELTHNWGTESDPLKPGYWSGNHGSDLPESSPLYIKDRVPVKGSCAEGSRKIKAQIGRFGGRHGLRETHQERWGASPPPFLMSFPEGGGRFDFQNRPI